MIHTADCTDKGENLGLAKATVAGRRLPVLALQREVSGITDQNRDNRDYGGELGEVTIVPNVRIARRYTAPRGVTCESCATTQHSEHHPLRNRKISPEMGFMETERCRLCPVKSKDLHWGE